MKIMTLFGLCGPLLLLLPSLGEARDAAPPSDPFVRLAAGLLSVRVHEVKVIALLDEVSRQAGFSVAPCTACEQRISVQFDRLPLERGLSIILQDQNFGLRWKRTPAAAGVVPNRLCILPQPTPAPAARARPAIDLVSVAIGSQASRQRSALSTGHPEDREQAAIAMGHGRDTSAVALLARALSDSASGVRRAAIEALAEIGGADAAEALAPALRDADPRLREAAVNALGDLGGPTAMALLRQAQRDETGFVRRAAIETLEALQGVRD